jgi:C1A family cysteine protease
MKNIILFTAILFSYNFFAQGYIAESTESLSSIEKYSKSTLGFTEDLPTNKTLEANVPPVGNQKDTGSCVAWSTSYYALSTIYNKKFNIQDTEAKYAHSFDPWYIYSLTNQLDNQEDCEVGLRASDALNVLKNIGPKKMLYPPFNYYCNENWDVAEMEKMYGYMSPYRISDFEMADPKNSNTQNLIKTEISKYGFPVVITLGNYSSSSLQSVGDDGVFRPVYQNRGGGHAMTIVGYDDYKNGGSYRVVNSWGKNWGDKGYCWIKYSDFKKYGDGAFFIWINEDVIDTTNPKIKTANYIRTNTTAGNIYEGQTASNSFTGFGILSDDDTYFIGNFKDGLKNGYFKVLNNEGLYYANYKNGVYVSDDELGFAGNEESLIKSVNTQEYLNQLFDDIKIKSYKE